ncbi:voltage-gated potassium channel [Balneicella halophila]|uniref:Voltage-gated potassium channel n=1 Tax=Balneicella halophila TaxID=1537566 RepID=A0A7L4UQ65_BALHA|nr:ion transporter [Balneicella halophila]PVX51925.1 voltage-gated potassium channel [Balneicella halophila]
MSKESVKKLKARLSKTIFGVSTPAGKAFDITLIILIILSILMVILESVPRYHKNYGDYFSVIEWIITIFFTIEYILRIWIVERPSRYIFSFYGIIDFLSILPSFLGLFIRGTQGLAVIRGVRLLRIFRILKLNRYTSAGTFLIRALKASTSKISVFLFAVIMAVIIIGTLMYLIEGPESGFTDIPTGIYWAVVTLTTVGYGDISPLTPIGQFLASVVMILGYGIIAVPTGIVTSEITMKKLNPSEGDIDSSEFEGRECPECGTVGHRKSAAYCYNCGGHLQDHLLD